MPHRTLLLVFGLLAAAVAPSPAQGDAAARRARSLTRQLTLEQQAAQLVMPFLPGTYAADDAIAHDTAFAWVDSLGIGGVVVSIGSPLDIAAKLNRLQRRSRHPLLVAADLEGGSAFRFQGGTPFPTNMGVAAGGRERDAFVMGRVTGLEARAVGIHLVFAPVADVNNNPRNPIINTRSFGADPDAVGRFVAATVRGLQSTGLVATVKHFPGHGDTETDSHVGLPVIGGSWDRLRQLELVPFAAAMEAGVGAVMSGHIAVPAIEPDTAIPATLSPRLMTDVLRDTLGFDGLVVTDALDMGALVERLGAGEVAVRALEAGADILLMPTDPAEAVRAVSEAVRAGRISPDRLARSVERVLAAKERAGLFRRRTVSLDRVASVVGSREFADSARAVTERALVLVTDSSGAVARLRHGPTAVALVTFGEAGDAGFGTSLAAGLRARGHRVTGTFRLLPASGSASYDSAAAVLADSVAPIFAVSVRASAWRGSIAMPEALARLITATAARGPTVLVSFGSPYLLAQVPRAGSLLLAWTPNAISQDAVAGALSGAAIAGNLPVQLPPDYPIGHGIPLPAVVEPAGARAPR